MDADSKELLAGLLKEVSRSFYLTLRVLPGKVRRQIGLAYLLARATDTIADTALVPVEDRLRALAALRSRILGQRDAAALDFGSFAANQGTPAERVLLEKSEAALRLLGTLAPSDLELVRRVLDTITSGQELDLRRFGAAGQGKVVALQTRNDLDDYTYRVAGCVGEFWTHLCRSHLFPRARLNDEVFLADGVRFGKGLQLVNILRDLPADLRSGRCYLPLEDLSPQHLAPSDLLGPESESGLRPVYEAWLGRAWGHLVAGWTYTNTLPTTQVRVRLACAWPILIGTETLQLLRRSPVLQAEHPVKVPRQAVNAILRRSVVLYPFQPAWKRLGPRAGGLGE